MINYLEKYLEQRDALFVLGYCDNFVLRVGRLTMLELRVYLADCFSPKITSHQKETFCGTSIVDVDDDFCFELLPAALIGNDGRVAI